MPDLWLSLAGMETAAAVTQTQQGGDTNPAGPSTTRIMQGASAEAWPRSLH